MPAVAGRDVIALDFFGSFEFLWKNASPLNNGPINPPRPAGAVYRVRRNSGKIASNRATCRSNISEEELNKWNSEKSDNEGPEGLTTRPLVPCNSVSVKTDVNRLLANRTNLPGDARCRHSARAIILSSLTRKDK